jgi:hypothetical protein
LGIPVRGLSVLEVGAGVGDHSHYYIDRGCPMTITEARTENLRQLHERYPSQQVAHLDMEQPSQIAGGPFDVIHCYGLLYHLKTPEGALEFLAENCNGLLLLETCVSFGDEESINFVSENARHPTQSFSGTGCRPTRPWLFSRLREQFEYVYIPKTQPNDSWFPTDWTAPEEHKEGLARAVFIASRHPLDNEILTTELIDYQMKHE